MSDWIDFRQLRANLDFRRVLESYGVEVKGKGHLRQQGFCPLPTHQGRGRSPSFSANLSRGIWKCFGCGAGGNVLDFAVRMEGLDPRNPMDVRKVAVQLQERFMTLAATPKQSVRRSPGTTAPVDPPSGAEEGPQAAKPVIVNAPLDFELKDLDQGHPYLKGRGFTDETVRHFGLGYCNRGLMKGRVVIPLHNHEGQLIGYAGRLTDDTAISDKNPKYLFPKPREREGKLYEFHKSLFLYNGSRIEGPVKDLIVVEGFASVWWLSQCGYHDVVALMGSDCSDDQAKLITSMVTAKGHAWVFPDGDAAGEQCAAATLTRVAAGRFVRWVRVSSRQPTDRTPANLEKLLWRP